MQVTIEKLSPVLLEFQVEVPATQVRTEVDKAFSALQKTARVRGFRPGKVPRDVLAHLYGDRIHADVAQRLVDSTLNRALADRNVQPLSRPAIAQNELRADDAFSYKARFEVRPEIEQVKWEGFEVKRPSTLPTADMIDAEIAKLRREHSTLQAPDPERPAKVGDVVRMAFTLEVGGTVHGAPDQEIETELGTGEVFAEIDRALVAMSTGEHKDVPVDFPDRHNNPDLRGKTAVFHITVKEIKERSFPEVDNEFAKDCGQDDLAALRESLRAKLEKELKDKATDAVAEALIFELCKANPIQVPSSLIEQQAAATEQELTASARRQGQRFEINNDIRARLSVDAEMKVRAGLLMAEIAKAKSVRVTPEDIEKGYAELAEQTGKNIAKVKAEYRDAKKQELLIGMIVQDKVLDLMEAASNITDA
jgi:trigger factor